MTKLLPASLFSLALLTPWSTTDLRAQEVKPAPVEAAANTQELVRAAQAATTAGRWEDAISGWKAVTKAAPKDGRGWHMLGYTLHAAGKLDEALPIHIKASEFSGANGATACYNVACVHALKGKKDEAIDWLEKAADKGFSGAAHIRGDSDMDALRDDTRFVKALERISALETGASALQVFAGTGARAGSRLLYWSGPGSIGQVMVGHGPVAWKDSFQEQLADGSLVGQRWRLGQNFWTTLDTNIPIQLGGVLVKPGLYYMTLKLTAKDKAVLELHDPDVARKMRLDASQPARLPAGLEVAMTWGQADTPAETLAITLSKDGAPEEGTLAINFGPYVLSCTTKAKLK